MAYAFFVQYTNVSVNALAATDFKLAIIDADSARGASGPITAAEIARIQAQGKKLFAYLSIGEAASHRAYWQPGWGAGNPPWILQRNDDFADNFTVAFWDPAWQAIVKQTLMRQVAMGFNGVFLDVVDVYRRFEVESAAGGLAAARARMRDCVERLSAAAKAVNPRFKVIQNNAQDLFTVDPDNHTSAPNLTYLRAIDGALAETTWFMPDDGATTWGDFNAGYMDKLVRAGKTMLALEYCGGTTARDTFVHRSIQHGYVPCVSVRNLDALVDYNEGIVAQLPLNAMRSLLAD